MLVGKVLVAPAMVVGSIIMVIAGIFASTWWFLGATAAGGIATFFLLAKEKELPEEAPKKKGRWPANEP